MKYRLPAALVLVSATLPGCVPFYAGNYEQNLYAPGGSLADKNEGSMPLATATESSLNTMFPAGSATKATVMQSLGNPMSNSSSSDGTSSQVFTHTFTSYARKIVQMQTAVFEYDKAGVVKKITFSNTNSSW